MADERLDIPDGADVKFVRRGNEFAVGGLETKHFLLVQKLGLSGDQIRQSNVDMGLISRSSDILSVGGESIAYKWPPANMPEIREETVRQLRGRFPGFDVI